MPFRHIFFLIVSLAALAPLAVAETAPENMTGRDLVGQCETYLANDAARPSPCRDFLIAHMTAFKTSQDERLAAALQGAELPDAGPCIRMPDFLSWSELARLTVERGNANTGLLDAPASALVLETLAMTYPCPEPSDAPSP